MHLKNAVKGSGHILAHALETAPKSLGLHAQKSRHGSKPLALPRQALRLFVVDVLYGMLDIAKENIMLGQPLRQLGRQPAISRKRLEHGQRFTSAQKRIAPASNDLQRLREKLDFTNAAAPQLDVDARSAPRELAPRSFGSDHFMQARQRRNGIEVQILSEDERTHKRRDALLLALKILARREDGGIDDSPLEPGKTLPVPPLGVEVLLQHVGRAHDRPGLAVGPQPHVNPKYEARSFDVIQGGDHPSCEPFIKLLHGQRAARIGKLSGRLRLTVFVIEEYEINV